MPKYSEGLFWESDVGKKSVTFMLTITGSSIPGLKTEKFKIPC